MASAPASVRSEIVATLLLADPVVVSQDLNRKNIYISASPIKSVNANLCGIASILKTGVTALVPKIVLYVQTKDMAWKLYSHLISESVSRCIIDVYHASLTPETKNKVYKEFRSSSSCLKCLISTIAFGMGMDIPDIEIVCVYGCPKTTSQLYQLFGRAGRGGMSSLAHLFFSSKNNFADKDLEHFAKSGHECRRKILVGSIGGGGIETQPVCCDVCSLPVRGRLNIFGAGGVNRRKRRRVVRTVNEELLEEKLKMAREEFLSNHPAFKMVGIDFVCPNFTIQKLCKEAKYIASVVDSLRNLD